MGGGQTLRVVTTHPDQFAYVGIWSAGLFGGNAAEWEKRNESFLRHADKVNKTVKLFSISVGDKDFAAERLEEPGGSRSRSTGSSTSCTSAAAATPGSTGGTTSASSPRGCSSEVHQVKPGLIEPTGPWRSEIRIGSRKDGILKKLPLADFGVFCKVPSPGIRQGKSESGHFVESAPRSDRAILGMRHSFPPSTFLSRSVEPRS